MKQQVTYDRPVRWDNPLDPDFPEAALDSLLKRAPFKDMNPDSFPAKQPLRQVLKNDTRIRRYRRGEIVMRQGDYGTSAFMVLSGQVRVVLEPSLPENVLGRARPLKKSLVRSIAQLWSNHRNPEVRAVEEVEGGRAEGSDGETHIFLQDIPRLVERHKTATIGQGEFFGEIAALSRMPRTASIFADSAETELLEIRWQGLRDIRKSDAALRRHIDDSYRDNTLSNALRNLPLMKHLDEAAIETVKAQTQFSTFGEYDWSGEYKKLVQTGTDSIQKETIIAQEGDYPDGVILVRSGFARLSQKHGAGQRTLNYVGAGEWFGLREIYHNYKYPEKRLALQYSLRVIGYTHTLFIPTQVLEKIVFPGLPAAQAPRAFSLDELDRGDDKDPLTEQVGPTRRIGPEIMEFLTAGRYFNGRQSMVINLDRCTRCDDCVRACAASHDNNPRFLRSGPSSHGIQIADACMHCVDPVCMIGCPTGAIHRSTSGGEVVINQATCIGCTTCATNCPYEAIRMVEARDDRGAVVIDQDFKPILKATKCDLCIEQLGGPACERACPHDALKRTNLKNLEAFSQWLHR